MELILKSINNCMICKAHLPGGPRPVVQLNCRSKIVIIGQAPGKRVHETGIPWNDPSGLTLRKWLNVNEEQFYNDEIFSILPMSFCYPGKGPTGDLPPRKECAPQWHADVFSNFNNKPLILLIGIYAQHYYLKSNSLTDTVRHYKQFLPDYFPIPHPSPRNQNWLKINPWFKTTVLPELQLLIKNKIK